MYTRIDVTGLTYSSLDRATELQVAVDQANAAHAAEPSPAGSAEHIAIDRTLQRRVAHVESFIKGSTYGHSAGLRTQLSIVRDELRNRLIASGQSPQPAGEPQTSLSQKIAELPDAVAERLARVLVADKNDPVRLATNLQNIFPGGSDPAAVASWRAFLNTHTITFLGGSNIINFKVDPILPLLEPSEVLKLEYRFGNPSRMDTVVRGAVPGLCTPSAASRMVRAPDKDGNLVGRSLMVTTLCGNGGAGSYAKRGRQDYVVAAAVATAAALRAAGRSQIDIDAGVVATINQLTVPGERATFRAAAAGPVAAAVLAAAADPLTVGAYNAAAATAATSFKKRMNGIAAQMCSSLQALELNGIYFPDAKLDNWVVERDGTLRVADTKSFKRSPPDVINEAHADNEGIGGRIRTGGFSLADIDVNTAPAKIHCSLLGRNIYYALTGQLPHDIIRPGCTEEVFQGAVGIKYKNLIEGLTQRTVPPPGVLQPSITLAQAARILREIEIMLAPAYAGASVPQKALMVALAATPGYEAANAGQRELMAVLAASPEYEAATPARRLLMVALATNPVYEAATPAQRALAATQAATPGYEAATPGQRALIVTLAASPDYEANTPARRTLMLALATNPVYEAATPAQRALVAVQAASPGYEAATPEQRAHIVTLAASPGYEAATPGRRALMLALATNPVYEAASPAQRVLVATQAATPEYEAAIPALRGRIVELAARASYEAASPAQRALVLALATNPSYEAANADQRTRMGVLAAKPLYEAATPEIRQRMIEAMLTPAYSEIATKIHDLGLLTGKDHTACLLASLHTACGAAEYDRDTALAAILATANQAYAKMVQANVIRAEIITPPLSTLGGQTLLPDDLLLDDKATSIGAPADLNALVAGLETHRVHLAAARDALPQIRGLQGLSDACNAKRFGDGDNRMDQYLGAARQDVLSGITLVTRVANAQRVHGELTAARTGLNEAVNQSVHDAITRLRGKYFARAAGAKATAIEHAAAGVPIPSRINMRAHMGDPEVRGLLNEMGRTRSLWSGLGAPAAKPEKIESYKLAMTALRKPPPPGDEPDRDNGLGGPPPV